MSCWFLTCIIVSCHVIVCARAWNLSVTGNSVIRILHVSVYRNRAFLSVKCSTDDEISTLVETSWPERTNSKFKQYPIRKAKDVELDICSEVIQSVTSDVERRGRLWVLDAGNVMCPAKLLVYNLYLNSEMQRCDLREIPGERLGTMVVDPVVTLTGPRAYIGLEEDSKLLVYSLKERRWWRLDLSVDGFSIGKQPTIAIARSVLYLTNKRTFVLYDLNLAQVRSNYGPPAIVGHEECIPVTVRRVGELLGPVSALAVDPRGQLNYFLARDSAVVQWDPKKPLTAEGHLVVAQGSMTALQMLFDQLGALWILSEDPESGQQWCIKLLRHYAQPAFG